MWFIKLISPTNIPRKKTEWNIHIRMYVWLLCQLKWLYAQGAISDTIIDGTINVIHNVRDYWFEQELHRFGIDIDQHINSHTIPIVENRKYRLPGIFNWAESLQIQCEGKNYTIDRANRLTIETDMDGTLKVSTHKDLFFRSTFNAKSIHTQGKQQDDNHLQQSYYQPKSDISPKKSTRKKITVKDTIPAKDTEPQIQFSTTKHQGFEENDAF